MFSSEKYGDIIFSFGVGKTTITKNSNKNIYFKNLNLSHYRTPRSNEIDGVDYFFVSKVFEELIKKKKFYEYAKIFENYYGTLKENVDKIIKKNDLIFDKITAGDKAIIKFKELNLIKYF